MKKPALGWLELWLLFKLQCCSSHHFVPALESFVQGVA
jgi:hypothetical protein